MSEQAGVRFFEQIASLFLLHFGVCFTPLNSNGQAHEHVVLSSLQGAKRFLFLGHNVSFVQVVSSLSKNTLENC